MTTSVLITGHRGFVGSHLHRRLHGDRRFTVTGIDLAMQGGDALDLFRRADSRFDWVIHCAALVGGRKTIEGNPATLAARDLALDAAMFEWATKVGVDRVVYFSSSAAYPIWMQQREQEPRKLHEDDIHPHIPFEPDASYGWVKLTGERLAGWCEQECGLRTHVFRPFSGYGTDQALDYPFPSFVARAVGRANPFDVWGDGTQARDFIHIDDIVAAVLTVIEADACGPLNLGTGRATTFNELASMCAGVVGYTPRLRHLTAEPVGAHHRVADVRRLGSFYTPKVTLEEGVERAVRAAKAAA